MSVKTHREKIQEIKNSSFTYAINYSNLSGITKYYSSLGKDISEDLQINVKKAYDFVDKFYPSANVKQANIYITSPYLLRYYRYNGIGGFYDLDSRSIIISTYLIDEEQVEYGIKGIFELDEILCHELIHYASMKNSPASTRYLEEEIAYGKSAIYLAEKGRSKEWIIKNNMLPYLINIVDKNSAKKRFLKKIDPSNICTNDDTVELLIKNNLKNWIDLLIEDSYVLGEKIINKYLYNIEIEEETHNIIKNKLINLDDEL